MRRSVITTLAIVAAVGLAIGLSALRGGDETEPARAPSTTLTVTTRPPCEAGRVCIDEQGTYYDVVGDLPPDWRPEYGPRPPGLGDEHSDETLPHPEARPPCTPGPYVCVAGDGHYYDAEGDMPPEWEPSDGPRHPLGSSSTTSSTGRGR